MLPATDAAANHLLANLVHFGRWLRRLGFSVSAGQMSDLAQALTYLDLERRDDVYCAARSIFVHSLDELGLFERAFDLFWGVEDRSAWELVLTQRQPVVTTDQILSESDEPVLRPASQQPDDLQVTEPDTAEETRLSSTYSPIETLHHKDFSRFSEEELLIARRFIESLVWQLNSRLTHRLVRAAKRSAHLDLPGAIRNSTRHGGEIIELAWRRRKLKPRPLVVICDVSGSMDRYSRLFLHFIYTLAQGLNRVEAFAFGTRLTRITPALCHQDVDAALDRVADLVQDWSGGTRIGESLKAFNYRWARRVLGHGAVVIIISDGWDRGDIRLLEREIARLHRSTYRLIWLNPLLGAPDYQPRVRGIQAVLPHVDSFLPLHNLLSLEQLATQLGTFTSLRRRTTL
jgi:uncharacterized protein